MKTKYLNQMKSNTRIKLTKSNKNKIYNREKKRTENLGVIE